MKKFSTAFLTIAMLITGTISAFGATNNAIGKSLTVSGGSPPATATLYEGSESFPLVASATQISNVEGTVTTGRGEVTVSAVNTPATLKSTNPYRDSRERDNVELDLYVTRNANTIVMIASNGPVQPPEALQVAKAAGNDAGNPALATANTATDSFGGKIVVTTTGQTALNQRDGTKLLV